MRKLAFTLLLLVSLVVTGCSSVTSAENSSLYPDITPPPPPESGKSTIIGRVLSSKTDDAMTNTFVRLADVYHEQGKSFYVLDAAFSPASISDDKGFFIFSNVPAGEYVITVGEFFSVWKPYEESGQPRIFKVEADQILDVGQIKINLEQ